MPDRADSSALRSDMIALTGARLFDGDRFHDGVALLLDGSRIKALVPSAEVPDGVGSVTLAGGILAPGFIDLQVNGGGGILLNDALDLDGICRIARAHAGLGATTILPTLITDTRAQTAAAIEAAIAAAQAGVPGIAGLHLEGPHLASARKGAHDGARLRRMEQADVDLYCRAAQDLPLLKITLAPEMVSPSQIAVLRGVGVLVSLGHSDCTFETARQFTEAGASTVTHLFNAMSQLGSREPGLAGAALSLGALSGGVIADGIHVHPETLKLALAAKAGPGRLYLVSDAMAVAGTDLDGFELHGRTITRCDGRLTLSDGTLAGADLSLADAMRRVAGLTGDLALALAMATAIPAEIAGLAERGRLAAGVPADLVWLDDDLRLRAVWQDGLRLSATEIPHTPQ